MKPLAFLVMAYLFTSSLGGLLAVSDLDEVHVREVISGLMRAWNVHDMHAFRQQFADDASFVNVNGSWLRDAAQIEESHKVVHATIFRTSRAVITPAQVRFPKSDVAIVHAKWQITGDSRRPEPRDYIMTLVVQKNVDTWKICAAQNGSAEDRSSSGFANLHPDDVASIPAPRFQGLPRTQEDRIGEAIAAFDRHWNRGDPSGLAELFMMNADWVDPLARWVRGNRDIAAHIVTAERSELHDAIRTSGIERLTLLHPDFAVAVVRWKIEQTDSARLQTQGMGLRVLQGAGKAWRILAAQDTVVRTPAR